MKILFFFVHPSKYHLFKHTINYLKNNGHQVDITIITKDVLEDLVQQEGWHYTNIFPEGRRSKSTHTFAILLTTVRNFLKTVWRLYMLTKGKNYDLFVTDDSLVVIGKLKKVPSLFFIDNELSTVPESSLLLLVATKIFAPVSVNLGKYENKKIGFKGYKELAYLHPNYFAPDANVVKKFNPQMKRYFLIRLVAMTASHDRGIKGISSEQLKRLVELLNPYGLVYVSSETAILPEFEKYLLDINPADIAHALFFADLFIGDSGTMASEAAIVGTPSIMYHDFIGRLGVMKEKEEKYGLMFGFRTNEFDKMIQKIQELIKIENLKQEFLKRRQVLLNDCIDVVEFMNDLIENYHTKYASN